MTLCKHLVPAAAAGAALLAAAPAHAQDSRYLGQIMLVANTYCPYGTAEANGAPLPITTNKELAKLFGTTYGGDGVTVFKLPDLRGRAANGEGVATGMSRYVLGQTGGSETTRLTLAQMPEHTHYSTMEAYAGSPNTGSPANASFADFPPGVNIYNRSIRPDVEMAKGTVHVESTGEGRPFPIHSPFLVMRYCVVTRGIVPPKP